MSKKVELSKRRVLGVLVVVGLASAAVGVGTFAVFSDTETSTDNTVNAGTLSLASPSDGVIEASDAVPTDEFSGTVNTTYSGSVNGEIDVNFTIAEPSSENSENDAAVDNDLSAAAFAQELEVTNASVTVGSTTENLYTGNLDSNGNNYTDLEDLANAGTFDNVTSGMAADGDPVSVNLEMTFRQDAGNDAQADGVNTTVHIVAEQSAAD